MHTVRAICYLPSREQESEVVTVKYTVIQRATNPECHPPSGSALAGNGGTVPVVLSVPLAESAIVFTVNGGDASECGSNEVCQLNLPVICPGQQESGGEPPARRRLLSDTEGAEGGDSDSAAAEDIPVCTYTIVAVGEATGYLESHPAVFTFTVADTTTANAATDNFIHSGNPSSGHIVQVGANGADGTPAFARECECACTCECVCACVCLCLYVCDAFGCKCSMLHLKPMNVRYTRYNHIASKRRADSI